MKIPVLGNLKVLNFLILKSQILLLKFLPVKFLQGNFYIL